VQSLRDVGIEEFERRGENLDGTIRRRARHVITENQRVLDSIACMQRGDSTGLGKLLNASHRSLRDDFEVSSLALNQMVECAWAQPGCHGARMTGGGFGGCALALVEAGQAEAFAAQITDCFRGKSGLEPQVYLCRASGGASALRLDA
jgi:galactokinase